MSAYPTPASDNRTSERSTVTVEEAAQMLGIGRSTAYIAVRDGSLPTIRIGRRLLVPRAQLDRMLGITDGERQGDSPDALQSSGGQARYDTD